MQPAVREEVQLPLLVGGGQRKGRGGAEEGQGRGRGWTYWIILDNSGLEEVCRVNGCVK